MNFEVKDKIESNKIAKNVQVWGKWIGGGENIYEHRKLHIAQFLSSCLLK